MGGLAVVKTPAVAVKALVGVQQQQIHGDGLCHSRAAGLTQTDCNMAILALCPGGAGC